MGEARLISTSTIHSTKRSGEPTERIELTAWDLRFLLSENGQAGLLFPKPTPSQLEQLQANTAIDHLKISLSLTLDVFPPLAGRLATIQYDTDNTSSFFIDCNNAGAHFLYAVADGVTIRDILEPVLVPPIVSSFFPMNGSLNCEGLSKPLLAVQVTELLDGLFVGFSMNHVVADGASFFHFLTCLSEIARGRGVISKPPILKRWFPRGIKSPIRIPLSLQDKDMNAYKVALPHRRAGFFHFTKEKIEELKAQANGKMGTNTGISSFQALVTHLWRCIMLCKGLNADQETTHLIVLDARPRLQPPLPRYYFGNAIYGVPLTTKVGFLLGSRGLSGAALEMKRTIAKQNDKEIGNWFKGWVANPTLVNRSNWSANGYFSLASSPRFDVYGNDMGWGRPVAMRHGLGNMSDGKAYIFQGAEEGSIDVEVCLLPEKLLALGRILSSEGVLVASNL